MSPPASQVQDPQAKKSRNPGGSKTNGKEVSEFPMPTRSEIQALLDSASEEWPKEEAERMDWMRKKMVDCMAMLSYICTALPQPGLLNAEAVEEPVKPGKEDVEVEMDEIRQQQLTGQFTLTTTKSNPAFNPRPKPGGERVDCATLAIDLLNRKFGVSIDGTDVIDAFQPNNTMICVRTRLGGHDSGYGKLVRAIYKPPTDREMNLFVNFAVTKKRSQMLYHLREMKRKFPGEVNKIYTDHRGVISCRVREGSPKVRLTYFRQGNDRESSPTTLFQFEAIREYLAKSTKSSGKSVKSV